MQSYFLMRRQMRLSPVTRLIRNGLISVVSSEEVASYSDAIRHCLHLAWELSPTKSLYVAQALAPMTKKARIYSGLINTANICSGPFKRTQSQMKRVQRHTQHRF